MVTKLFWLIGWAYIARSFIFAMKIIIYFLETCFLMLLFWLNFTMYFFLFTDPYQLFGPISSRLSSTGEILILLVISNVSGFLALVWRSWFMLHFNRDICRALYSYHKIKKYGHYAWFYSAQCNVFVMKKNISVVLKTVSFFVMTPDI